MKYYFPKEDKPCLFQYRLHKDHPYHTGILETTAYHLFIWVQFLCHGRGGCCHKENTVEVCREKNIIIQKLQVRNMACPESQGALVAEVRAEFSLESAHTKTVDFGL